MKLRKFKKFQRRTYSFSTFVFKINYLQEMNFKSLSFFGIYFHPKEGKNVKSLKS